MRFFEWFRPGIRVKRWIFLAILGILAISYGMAFIVNSVHRPKIIVFLSVILISAGTYFVYIAVRFGLGTIFSAIRSSGFNISLDGDKLTSLLLEKRILIKGPKIVTIGGGTGLSTMLRGLKEFSSNITAIVTVADDGGGSGTLRQDLGMLPPGDIRNCILALADTEPIMMELMQYRFMEGRLKGQSFGNLFLAAMDGISNNFEEAVKKMSDVLAVTGKVLPVTLTDVTLCAELEDGSVINGESKIGEGTKGKGIKRVFLEPESVEPIAEAIEAIKEADVIILGPGSVYTSIIPNLLIKDISTAVENSSAIKIYICNIMTQPGETEGYTVSKHIKSIFNHSKQGIVDYCIVNNAYIPNDILEAYREDGAEAVKIDSNEVHRLGVRIVEKDLLKINNNLVRHDTDKLAQSIIEIVSDKVLSRDKKRTIDYFYVKDRMRRAR